MTESYVRAKLIDPAVEQAGHIQVHGKAILHAEIVEDLFGGREEYVEMIRE